ncbi:hypothetical protein AGABI1DRAFT_114754 [Agaricus bisporus var. burnettii JB137-S8]|uniref:Heme haloperoxidase family profile domain-containing protein n=1 Tax=Agaricus bisporus var. burnettii (strain JB137-S8 / ATCC MYA-4627 / FGSC 10392) TaxID=597362 RepID=K5WSW4_AGABU|nr:uncharacterized protein AGABI1DRAFT_114754 [Agaricus bisporus var. burnettii JB137-S8]EKM78506.1 hypothetical protein AGABI1DRAFT_114754 [Agaricus bisporus var. burnettii JB137-S8]
MARFASFVVLAISLVSSTIAFPASRSLAGLSIEERDAAVASLRPAYPRPPPPPLADDGTKLVNDAAHRWRPAGRGDKRGPCPGLNTLSSHNWMPRNGVVTPYQMVDATQEGFNMESTLARRFTYSSHLIDGNVITDLMSIGAKTDLTGPAPPPPANPGGLNLHGFIEGDASFTRGDAFHGDNWQFNQTLFDEFAEYINKYGAGNYNYTVAGEFRYQRIQESIATNPQFNFRRLRFFAAYIETIVGVNLFTDGRRDDGQVPLEDTRSFFQDARMPDGFHRAAKPYGLEGTDVVFAAHPFTPGSNVNGINSYETDTTSPDFGTDPDGCIQYAQFINEAVAPLYPNATGILRRNLNLNLQYYFDTFGGKCEQIFPFGKDDEDDN